MGKETFAPSLLLLAISAFLTAISFPLDLAKRRLIRSEQKRKRKWIDSKKTYVKINSSENYREQGKMNKK